MSKKNGGFKAEVHASYHLFDSNAGIMHHVAHKSFCGVPSTSPLARVTAVQSLIWLLRLLALPCLALPLQETSGALPAADGAARSGVEDGYSQLKSW